MKKILFVIMFSLISFAHAEVVEGQLLAKVSGDLGAKIGNGCLSIVEYYVFEKKKFVTLGIYEDDVVNCMSEGIDEYEEIDIYLSQIHLVKNKDKVKKLSYITHKILGIDRFINFYELK